MSSVRFGRVELIVAKNRRSSGAFLTVFDLFKPAGKQSVSRELLKAIPSAEQLRLMAVAWDKKLNDREARKKP